MFALDRRRFLRSSAAAALSLTAPPDLIMRTAAAAPATGDWDAGPVRLLLPTVSDSRMLIKISFDAPLSDAPTLRIGGTSVRGRMGDTRGAHWHFYATDLNPGRPYRLELAGARGAPLCQPWELATFPGADERPEKFRLLIYTCAGGHEVHKFLPTAARNRLLRRALSFAPDAVVANGDHVYWDLLAPVGSRLLGMSPDAVKISGTFDRSATALGTDNEAVLKRAAGPQIVPVYGTDFRSTPMFFLQDDHDYFDNDEATDEVITFPPSYFMLELARATQGMYYPEFLPDVARPLGLPWSSAGDRVGGVSESFGTLRYGRLAEILLYDFRRSQTLAGPSAVYVDPEVEKWLKQRSAATEVTHLVHVPSLPPGWTAGKWGDWYPDVLGRDGNLTDKEPKPYWQSGWLKQHDRLMEAMSAMKSTRAAGHQRRPACDRHRPHAAQRRARPASQSDHHGDLRTGRLPHDSARLAVRPARRRLDAAGPSRHGGGGEADRAAWLHAGRFHARQDGAAVVQMGLQDPDRRPDGYAAAVPHDGAGAAGVRAGRDRQVRAICRTCVVVVIARESGRSSTHRRFRTSAVASTASTRRTGCSACAEHDEA